MVSNGTVAVLEPGLYMYIVSIQGTVPTGTSSSNSILVSAGIGSSTAVNVGTHSLDSGQCFGQGFINMTDIGFIDFVYDGSTRRMLRTVSVNTLTLNLNYNSISITIQRIR
jgi:hypothetical protein